MPHFPMFVDLRGKRVLIVGGGSAAGDKAERLAPFGAEVCLLDALTPAELSPPPAMVILTGEDRDEYARLCREKNIPVNSVDDPENCGFFFPSLICRGEMCVGISTAGCAPAAGMQARRLIQEALPEDMERILPWLSELTWKLRQRVPECERRGELLRRITRSCFEKNRPLTGDELREICM